MTDSNAKARTYADLLPVQRKKLLTHLIGLFGANHVRNLIKAWEQGTPDHVIAPQYGVSGQRIGQWRRVLGRRVTRYEVYPVISALVPKGD